MLITDKSLRGYLAMWVCRQHPYRSVAGVDEVGALIDAKAVAENWTGNDELRMRLFADWREVEHWLRAAIGDHPQLTAWNTPKSERKAEFVFVSRYNSIEPEHDFIDISALLRNVALGVWREAERDAAFDAKFEAEHGPLPTGLNPPQESGSSLEPR